MAEVSHSRTIAAAPQAIWDVLADFGALSAWAGGIDHSCLLHDGDHPSGLGTTRRVQIGRDTFVETITAFEPPWVLTYDIAGLPYRLTASNHWNLDPTETSGTTVTLTSTASLDDRVLRRIGEPAAARLIAKRSATLLDSLAKATEGITA